MKKDWYGSFPERVWEQTGTLPDGTPIWSSRPATKEDRDRRREFERKMM